MSSRVLAVRVMPSRIGLLAAIACGLRVLTRRCRSASPWFPVICAPLDLVVGTKAEVRLHAAPRRPRGCGVSGPRQSLRCLIHVIFLALCTCHNSVTGIGCLCENPIVNECCAKPQRIRSWPNDMLFIAVLVIWYGK